VVLVVPRLAVGFREFEVHDPAKPLLARDGERLFVAVTIDPKHALPPSLDSVPSAVVPVNDVDQLPAEREVAMTTPNHSSYREQDPWQANDTWTEDRDREAWSRQDDNELEEPVADTPMTERNGPPSPMAVAAGLTAAGWWLRRHGTFPGALLAGFVAGVFVWLSDDGVVDSFDVVLQHLP
jgi:hypothetical protein